MTDGGIVPGQDAEGTVWEDGLGRKDADATVLSQDRMTPTADPQSLRYGQGDPEVVVQAVIGGPAFRERPFVDVYWHEGLRPSFMRLPPDQARRIAEMLSAAAASAGEHESRS
jgi:hypothetical protein